MEEQIQSAVDWLANAGAQVLHLHVRELLTAAAASRLSKFNELIAGVRARGRT